MHLSFAVSTLFFLSYGIVFIYIRVTSSEIFKTFALSLNWRTWTPTDLGLSLLLSAFPLRWALYNSISSEICNCSLISFWLFLLNLPVILLVTQELLQRLDGSFWIKILLCLFQFRGYHVFRISSHADFLYSLCSFRFDFILSMSFWVEACLNILHFFGYLIKSGHTCLHNYEVTLKP